MPSFGGLRLLPNREFTVKTCVLFSLVLVPFLSAACVSFPATSSAPAVRRRQPNRRRPRLLTGRPTPIRWASASAIRATWSQEELPQQAGETFQTVVVQGPEGEVDLHWGVGFGGACPQGYTTVKVAEGELPACYSKNADGTEVWTQINKELEATSFSAEARTSNADPASHDLVLEVLSTLSFPPPEQSAARALTARMLTAPNALVGPSPSSFNWSPVGATLAYVEPQDGQDMLWLYDAATGDKKVLLDPAKSPGNIDVTSAQWSPQGDRLLLDRR